jgi:uncharacterized protein YpuA (DUF1002 family)
MTSHVTSHKSRGSATEQRGRSSRRSAHSSVRRRVALSLAALFVVSMLAAGVAFAQGERVVSLGADLNPSQRQEMLDLFNVDEGEVRIVEVTNAEERQELGDVVPLRQIGSRAISSVYVEVQDDGSGINVETRNITYITEQTYANALVTAGVENADVFAAAPFEVSGTAALTGIFKAFEEATGETISQEEKETAAREMVDTAEVGEEVGDQEAVAELMKRAKEEVVRRGLDDPEEVRRVVIEISGELNINLTEEQIDRLVAILIQIQGLDIDFGRLQEQLRGFQDRIGITGEEAQGIIQRILDAIQGIFDSIRDAIFG